MQSLESHRLMGPNVFTKIEDCLSFLTLPRNTPEPRAGPGRPWGSLLVGSLPASTAQTVTVLSSSLSRVQHSSKPQAAPRAQPHLPGEPVRSLRSSPPTASAGILNSLQLPYVHWLDACLYVSSCEFWPGGDCALQRVSDNVWRHFWLSQRRGSAWHPLGVGQGCCWTSHDTQESWQSHLPKTPRAPRRRNAALRGLRCSRHSAVSDSRDPVDCSLPGSSVHGILQARTLEWATIPFSRGWSWPRDRTRVSCTAGGLFNTELPEKPQTLL